MMLVDLRGIEPLPVKLRRPPGTRTRPYEKRLRMTGAFLFVPEVYARQTYMASFLLTFSLHLSTLGDWEAHHERRIWQGE